MNGPCKRYDRRVQVGSVKWAFAGDPAVGKQKTCLACSIFQDGGGLIRWPNGRGMIRRRYEHIVWGSRPWA